MRNPAHIIVVSALLGVGLALPGCAPAPAGTGPTTQSSSSMYDRQQQAMKRPLEYSPFQENPDVSGGGIGDFDAKSFAKELHDFFNP